MISWTAQASPRKPAPLWRTVACAGLLLTAACASPPAAPAPSVAVTQDWTAADYQYRLAPGDELRVHFPIDTDLDAQVTLGPDGRGVLPLIKGLPLAGLTIEEADAALLRAYAQVLRAPQVEATLVNYAGAQIYVTGEVREAGVKPIRGAMGVTKVVMAAGGFQDSARIGVVVVLRPGGPGRLLMRTVSVEKTLQGGDGGDFRLLPGDIVFVPRSKISEVDRVVRQYVTSALPFSMNYAIDRYRVP